MMYMDDETRKYTYYFIVEKSHASGVSEFCVARSLKQQIQKRKFK